MRAVLLTCTTLFAVVLSRRAVSAGSAPRCLEHNIPDRILGELLLMVHRSKHSLPKDENKHKKLLPNFSRSLKKSKGISIIKEMLDFYFYNVFSDKSLEITNQEEILTFLSRLRQDVSYCLGLYPSNLSSKEKNLIRNMKNKFMKMRRPGVYKALGEFKTLLIWMDTYMHSTNSRRKRNELPVDPTAATEATTLV
ncbi:interleukin-10-like [Arapaima gigas]